METKKLIWITVAVVSAAVILFALVARSRSGGDDTLVAEIPLEGAEGDLLEEPGLDETVLEEEVVEEGGESGDSAEEADTKPDAKASSFLSEGNRRSVVLFFQKVDSDLLAPERRRIFMTASPADQAKQIVVELINGPNRRDLLPTVPPEARVLGLFIDRSGTAYVDLSDEAIAFHPGGSAAELATIFSLVNTLTYNLDEIDRVRILVGGIERDTLKSHLDLSRAYVQDLSIVDRRR
jgi:hypothetical protein